MALATDDRICEISNSLGLADFVLSAIAPVGFKPFAQMQPTPQTGQQIPYLAEGVLDDLTPSGEWETGFGELDGNTLKRMTVSRSSNANAKVNFSGGRKLVQVDFLADDLRNLLDAGNTELTAYYILAKN